MDPIDDPLVGDAIASDYCTTPAGNYFAEVLRSGYCGVAEVFGVGRDTAVGVTGNAASAADAVTGNAAGAADAVSGNAADAANPLNLFGLGAGVAGGGLVATAGLAAVGALAIDQVFFAGAGTASLARRVSGRRR